MSSVAELTTFIVRAEDTQAMLDARPGMIEAFRQDRRGFLSARLVRVAEVTWLDFVEWIDDAAWDDSTAKGANRPEIAMSRPAAPGRRAGVGRARHCEVPDSDHVDVIDPSHPRWAIVCDSLVKRLPDPFPDVDRTTRRTPPWSWTWSRDTRGRWNVNGRRPGGDPSVEVNQTLADHYEIAHEFTCTRSAADVARICWHRAGLRRWKQV
jgi:hypothetical protein